MSMLSLGEQVSLILNPTQLDNFPSVDFCETDLRRIGFGVNNIVYLAESEKAVFVIRKPLLDRKIGELWNEFRHYMSLAEFVGNKYLPDALFIWDRIRSINGCHAYCITSFFSEFTAIDELSDSEYFALKDQLIEVIKGMIKMMEETGEVVDISGNKGRFFFNLMNFRRSENVVVIEVNGERQVIIMDFGRGNFLARIPFLKDLIRTMFIFGLNRALKALNNYADP